MRRIPRAYVRARKCRCAERRIDEPAQVMEKLNELGGKHGIGRVDMVENRFVGMKSRGV